MIGQDYFTEALLEGSREVFETMMFMTVEPCNDVYDAIEGEEILGSITFKGRIEGCLAICCNLECAGEIAINMLGMEPDEELSDEEVEDAIGEVANMILGAVKTRIMDQVGDVQVSIPSVVKGSEMTSSMGEGAEEISVLVNIDEHIAELHLMYRDASQ